MTCGAAPLTAGMTTKQGVFLGCGLALVAAIALGAGIFFFVMRLTGPMAETGDQFMTALQRQRYDDALALCTPSLRADVESKGGLEAMAERYKLRPTAWSYSSRSVQGNAGELSGTARYEDGTSRALRLTFSQSGDGWRVNGFNFD